MTRADLLAVGAVLGAAVVMLGLLGVSKRFIRGSEGLRKLAHLGTGGLALLFPWLFSSLAPVLLVCGLSLLLLVAVSSLPLFATGWAEASTRSIGLLMGSFTFPLQSLCCSVSRAETGCCISFRSWC